MFKIGVDIGGTFTDFAIWSSREHGYARIGSHKLPSSRPDYSQAVIRGIEDIAASHGLTAEDEILIVHGTTVSTNAIIERSQPPLGLVTTAGYRDILELARLRLDKPVDLFNRRPTPLVAREHVFEVRERMTADGAVETALDEADLVRAAEGAQTLGLSSLALCFLHSYRNSAHEAQAAKFLRERYTGLDVTASHEVWPQQSEYERAILTVLNLYVKRLMESYLREIDRYLTHNFPKARLLVMKSNGGAMSAGEAAALPVHTLLSGPAGGVTAARELTHMLDIGSVLTMDMGGTSTDVSLVQEGRSAITAQAEVGDFPLLLPVTAVEALGAGGGSLVWLDQGVLKVGPQSAGSVPGPACYDQGGTVPTLTDAYLLCGYLPPAGLLGGRLPLSLERAEEAFATLSGPTGMDVPVLADAAIAVASSNMLARIMPFLARLGVEPSELTLMIFGGAGGIHGPLLAAEIGLKRIFVPRLPSVFCAFGCLVADLVHDAVSSVRGRPLDDRSVAAEYDRLAGEGAAWVEAQGSALTRAEHHAEMRYGAQAFTIPVDVTACIAEGTGIAGMHAAFHKEHQRLFAHSDTSAGVAIDELRTRSIGGQEKPHTRPETTTAANDVRPRAARDLRISGKLLAGCPIYDRGDLPDGWSTRGPAIIEQDVATILVPPGFRARVGGLGDLWIEMEDEA